MSLVKQSEKMDTLKNYSIVVSIWTIFKLHCSYLVYRFIKWCLISMWAGLAALRFDWLKVGLIMDLPIFVYSINSSLYIP